MSQNQFQRFLFPYVPDVLVYFGCALTQAPGAFKKGVEELKAALRSQCTVLEFLGLTAGTCRDVWVHDIERCVQRCHLFVAICDYPSIGLGVEFGVQAVARGMPILAVAHTGSLVTRLVQDPKVSGEFNFIRYENLLDLVPIITERVRCIRAEMVESARKATELTLEPDGEGDTFLPQLRAFRPVSAMPVSLAA